MMWLILLIKEIYVKMSNDVSIGSNVVIVSTGEHGEVIGMYNNFVKVRVITDKGTRIIGININGVELVDSSLIDKYECYW